MKEISARAALISLFFGLAVVTSGQAEEYYFYQTPTGALVISNKEPPPGSKIIKQLPGLTDRQVPQAQEPDKPQSNVESESLPKPSKDNQP